MPMFTIGKLVMTRTINDTIADNEDFAKEIASVLRRYLAADWGDLSLSDKKANDSAVETGYDRIFAAYNTTEGKIYITTEWDRSYSTVMFAQEY